MEEFHLVLRVLLVSWLLFISIEGCSKDMDCNLGQHCCKSYCTTSKVQCSRFCDRDEHCNRNHLCDQNQSICVACSKRFNCELKTCFNHTDCPQDYECKENKMCSSKVIPKQHTFTLLPFIVIIAVLGFALIVLCYTEGCWKELFVYLKRHWGRYGSVALNEFEAERREGQDENESRRHLHTHDHSNKSSVNNVRNDNMRIPNFSHRNSQSMSTNNDSLQVQNTQAISQHSRTLVTVISEAIRNQSRASRPTSIVTSSTDFSGPNTEARNSGSEPMLTSSHINTDPNTSESPPTYLSLFTEEFEEPPPKYEDVVNIVRVPIYIEMNPISSNASPISTLTQENSAVETMV